MSADSHTKSKALADRATAVIPGGVNSGTRRNGAPYAFESAAGAYITDFDGNRYLDYHAAFGAILLGHRHAVIEDAMAAAADTLDLSGYGVSEAEVKLAELIVEVLPSVEQTVILNSGSEAVAYAIRLARASTDRKYLVKFQGGFHGWSESVARNVISPKERAYGDDPVTAGILPDSWQSTLIAEFNDLESVKTLFEQYPEQIAAVIVEPIPHNVGALVPTKEFIEGLRTLTTEQGALLIFDEVITGFRHALGGYQQICAVTPDLTTFGKAMGNGYPVAGLGGKRELMQNFDAAGGKVALMGTFNGNATSCAAGIATITYLKDNPDFYTRTHALGERWRSGLRGILSELEITAEVVGFGGTFSTYFIDHRASGFKDLLENDVQAAIQFHRRMIDRGVLMLPLPLKRNHISGSHTAEDIDMSLNAAQDALQSMIDDDIVSRG
ncbi:aspartate aminotransferase family protein [Nakamurella lactea]|uniref:aspartate aminotransferase family protein n=1 Tax=Nakamurella lactea TaxID=459515 RepID=UPI000490908B|nr:aspartate aminotransferase family protein [Nakamurella lactea]